jgi:hypothetical protein
MLKYNEARPLMIQSLSQAANYHEAGTYEKLNAGFDEMDSKLPRRKGARFSTLLIALNFWDSWIDASNHQWQYYPGIEAEDWPLLARRIVADLKAERPISDPLLLEWFGPEKTTNWRETVVSLWA